jgi:hypothetical protein
MLSHKAGLSTLCIVLLLTWRRVAQPLICLTLQTQRVPRPSRPLRRAGTTNVYATGLGETRTLCRQHRARPFDSAQGRPCKNARTGHPSTQKAQKPNPPSKATLKANDAVACESANCLMCGTRKIDAYRGSRRNCLKNRSTLPDCRWNRSCP